MRNKNRSVSGSYSSECPDVSHVSATPSNPEEEMSSVKSMQWDFEEGVLSEEVELLSLPTLTASEKVITINRGEVQMPNKAKRMEKEDSSDEYFSYKSKIRRRDSEEIRKRPNGPTNEGKGKDGEVFSNSQLIETETNNANEVIDAHNIKNKVQHNQVNK